VVARYHFRFCDRRGWTEDEEGRELVGMATVRAEAVKGLRSIAQGDIGEGLLDLAARIEVTDAEGRPLMTITVRDAVEFLSPEGGS
jgi:hypothetical protein